MVERVGLGRRDRWWLALAALACLAVSVEAAAQSRSRAHGAPNHGRLTDGVLLEATEDMLVLPGAHRWGTEELVGMLRRSATRLQQEDPGPRALVGELSRESGGFLPPHGSHQNGRDADVGYLMTDEQGQPVEVTSFVELYDDMCARVDGAVYCLDRKRTFLLFAAMVDDPVARVQWILVAADLRQRILAAGRRSGVDPELYDRVEELTAPRQGSEVHRNHFHVRIQCPEDDMPGCQHQGPTPVRQPWRDTPRRRRAERASFGEHIAWLRPRRSFPGG
jgi:penicillin-insensitive murein endopeptidase